MTWLIVFPAILSDSAEASGNTIIKRDLKTNEVNDMKNTKVLIAPAGSGMAITAIKSLMLDSDIEITIGPYEVYEDGLFGYKASFESCVTIKDREESEKLKIYAKHLKEIDSSLPVDKKFKFTKVQAEAILEMKLQSLANLERKKLKDELEQKRKQIKELKLILKNPQKILTIITSTFLVVIALFI